MIFKIIAKRLEKLLPSMISPSQYAFVKGNLLIENVLLATKLVQQFNQKNISSRGVLKVDFRKTFDSLNWDFIIKMLLATNVLETFVTWIKQCVTTTSFSINIITSMEVFGFFRGTKGLRHGNSISPYLFVMPWRFLLNCLIPSSL